MIENCAAKERTAEHVPVDCRQVPQTLRLQTFNRRARRGRRDLHAAPSMHDRVRLDSITERIIGAAMEARATQPERSGRILTVPLTDAELRVLKLLPTTSYMQIAATLYISRNTVKTHLRSIYQKLGGASRSEAIERAVELRLL